jgi:hypothetical protein
MLALKIGSGSQNVSGPLPLGNQNWLLAHVAPNAIQSKRIGGCDTRYRPAYPRAYRRARPLVDFHWYNYGMNTTATSREVAQSQRGDSAVATATAITRYNHPDNLGSTNVTSDTAGNLAQWFDYAPYGSVLASDNTGTTTAARQYIGQFSDASGLSYLNARYYKGHRESSLQKTPCF